MTHIATIQLQDYFHHKAFDALVARHHWTRFESELEKSVGDTLELLDTCDVKATFFTLGWIAERFPELIRRIAGAGHELASCGYWGHSPRAVSEDAFYEDIVRAKKAIEDVSGLCVVGYRSVRQSLGVTDLSILGIIRKAGYLYDSSLMPTGLVSRRVARLRYKTEHETLSGRITEIPHSTSNFAGVSFPIGGGNYLRQFPYKFMAARFKHWCRSGRGPFVLYFHPWELSSRIPEVSAFGLVGQVRQYRNLGKMQYILPRYFAIAPFGTAANYLRIAPTHVARQDDRVATGGDVNVAVRSPASRTSPTPVTAVIPCHNESKTLPFLDKALHELEEESKAYSFSFIFVDDKSTDNTLRDLRNRFGDRPNCRVVALEQNRGVSGAIRAGIDEAETDVVCSMDADCSYDPLELIRMIPLLDRNVDMVTASPYHPDGAVLGVPGWRLFLSRSLSSMYHRVLSTKLATYTSCFRVYRRPSVQEVTTRYGDFRGILELLAKLDFSERTIIEYPTTLQSRLFGASKMKTLYTIRDHFRLMSELIREKRRGPKATSRASHGPELESRTAGGQSEQGLHTDLDS